MKVYQKTNTKLLELVDDRARPLFIEVLSDVASWCESPLIHKDVWRTVETQAEKVAGGNSKTIRSAHTRTLPDGAPASRAMDVVDARLWWNAPPRFWKVLGRAALCRGLIWGGLFGLPNAVAMAVQDRLLGCGDFEAVTKLGWDPAHVEWKP